MFSSLYGENDVRIPVVLLVCEEKKETRFPFSFFWAFCSLFARIPFEDDDGDLDE